MTGTEKFTCLLFDLDGTLVLTGGAGLRAFDEAFYGLFNVEGRIKSVSPAGKTDPQIFRMVCERYLDRPPTPDEETRFFEAYLKALAVDMETKAQLEVMPGIRELLERLAGNDQCLLGLGTGNIEEGARTKLMTSGLWDFFTFGGFGSDAYEREGMLAAALERATKRIGPDARIEVAWVIGDTPRDIEAGRAVGAKTLGVATGPYDRADLVQAGADLAYDDLGDYETVLADMGIE